MYVRPENIKIECTAGEALDLAWAVRHALGLKVYENPVEWARQHNGEATYQSNQGPVLKWFRELVTAAGRPDMWVEVQALIAEAFTDDA